MEQELAVLTSDELMQLYHKVKSKLVSHLLNCSPWQNQQERIKTLSRIARELTQRKVEVETHKKSLWKQMF